MRVTKETNGSETASTDRHDANTAKALLIAYRFWPLAAVHAMLFALAYYVAFSLRFEFELPAHWQAVFLSTLPWILAIKLVTFGVTGELHGWLRHVTLFVTLSHLPGFACSLWLRLRSLTYSC